MRRLLGKSQVCTAGGALCGPDTLVFEFHDINSHFTSPTFPSFWFYSLQHLCNLTVIVYLSRRSFLTSGSSGLHTQNSVQLSSGKPCLMLTLGQIRDSSLSLYSQDPWSFFDIAMVLIFGNPFKLRELMRSAGWLVARVLG